jgi:hypothetical protein
VERREDATPDSQSHAIPTPTTSDLGLVELDTDARRAQQELEDEYAVQLITGFFIVAILGLLTILAIVKIITSGDMTDGRPMELSSVEVRSDHS